MQDPSRTTDGRTVFYEPLTADNAAVLLVDHQVGLFTRIVDIDVLTLKHNVVALAKEAKVLKIPTILTTAEAAYLRDPGTSSAWWAGLSVA